MDNTLATQCIDRQIAALSRLHHVIQTDEYKRLVEVVTLIARRKYKARVMIAGVGKNSNIASKISETMASLGIPSFYLNVSHCGHGDYGFIGHEDMVIHISRSGTTREMLEAINHIRLIRPGVTQALIHCKAGKPRNESVDIELFIGSVAEGDEFGLAPTTSTTALLCALDCVSVQVSHNIGFQRLDFLKFHPDGALGAMLKAEQENPAKDLTHAPAEKVSVLNDPNLAEMVAVGEGKPAEQVIAEAENLVRHVRAYGALPPDPQYIGMTAAELKEAIQQPYQPPQRSGSQR